MTPELRDVRPVRRGRLIARTLTLAATLVIASGLGLVLARTADAVPANPAIRTLTQPDGGHFRARLWGDEYANGYETKSGYTVVKDGSGTWVYADRTQGGDLRATHSRPDEDPPPPGVTKHERPDADRPAGAPGDDFPSGGGPSFGPIGGGHVGAEKLLVIFTSFLNRSAVGTDAAYWNNQFFGPSGSVKDFYAQASFGALTLVPAAESQGTANDGVISVPLGYNHPDPGGGGDPQAIARDAINAANPSIDFAALDTNNNGIVSARELHIIVVLAGYETAYGSGCGPSVWGHNWTIFSPPTVDGKLVGGGADAGYSMFGEFHCAFPGDSPGHPATMGIMAHELGHDLGYPDLYDTNGGSAGIGSWSIMAGGSWLGTTFAGDKPSMVDAFSKYYQGWITPTAITGAQDNVTLGAAVSNPTAIRLGDNPNGVDWSFGGSSGTGEYFLVENRQKTGLDSEIPGCGLLIWHIDETRTAGNDANANENRKLVDLEEADGFAEMDDGDGGDAGDPYPGSSNNLNFNAGTNPNSNLYVGGASGSSVHLDSTTCLSSMQADFVGPTGPLRALSASDISVTEGGVATFTLAATNPGAQVTVNVATSNGSASAPGDYSALSTTTVTIPANATSVPVTVQTAQDSTSEPSETFFLNLSSPGTGAAISDASATGTIVDDDIRSISVNDISVTEGGLATFTVSATNPGLQVTVGALSSNGTAVAGSDYTMIGTPGTPPDGHGGGGTPPTPLVVTIPGGSSSVTVSTQTTQDATQESNETFSINLSGPSAGAAIGDASGTATINDDDTPTLVRSVTVNDVSVTEGGTATFTVSATNPGTQVSVNAATSNGSASAPGDYAALSTTTFTIPANATSIPVTVQTAQDTTQEPSETFFLNLSNASSGAAIGDGSGTATILDDDAPSGPRAISVNDITVGEGGLATFTISATNPGTQVTVKAMTADDTALAGSDYTAIEIPGTPPDRPGGVGTPATPVTVTIPASSTSVTLSTQTTQDVAQETAETFVLNLTSPSAGATISDAQGQATIDDDDAPGRSITVNDISVGEGDVATFTVSATNVGTQVTVNVATSNGSASAPGDYTSQSTTVTIPANATSVPVSVQTTEDSTQESSETFFLNLSGASAGATIGDASGTATIVDDDAPAVRSITVGDVSVMEGGVAIFTISATNPGNQVTVSAATSNGSAAAPGDYTAIAPTTVTIPANATSVTVSVPTTQETLVEPSETFFLNLSNASAGAAISDGQGQATILNDDVAGPNPR